MIQRPPLDLLPGKITDHVDRGASLSCSVTGHMKAYVIEAFHKEAYTVSLSEYVRDIIALHVAEVLEISPMQVLSNAPSRQAVRKRRFETG